MSHSKILKDLVNNDIALEIALKRTKLLLSKLNNKEIDDWVTSELIGYADSAELPEYRVIKGTLIGNYFRGTPTNYLSYKNASIPLGRMSKDMQNKVLNIEFTDSVAALKALASPKQNSSHISKAIPADCYQMISHEIGDPLLSILSAHVDVGCHEVDNILSKVENILIDILIKLEKEFGNLDELDIDTSEKREDELKRIAKEISIIINDNSVTIGDGNTIKGSNIST